MTLSHPEVLEQRATLKCLDLCQILTHNGEMAEVWEKGKPNHAGKSREKYLQGDDARAVLCNCLIRQPICCALLNKKKNTLLEGTRQLHRDLDCVPLHLSRVSL